MSLPNETEIRAVQTRLGLKVDGQAGNVTWKAILAAVAQVSNLPSSGGEQVKNLRYEEDGAEAPVDPRSEDVIRSLQPQMTKVARRFLRELNAALPAGFSAKLISGLRTYAEQDALFAQGRSKPGNRVTKAPAGFSNHNFGLAFDVGIFQGAKYLDDSPHYRLAGRIGKALGLAWGGDWQTIQDEPHFELRPRWAAGLSEGQLLAGLRERKANGSALV